MLRKNTNILHFAAGSLLIVLLCIFGTVQPAHASLTDAASASPSELPETDPILVTMYEGEFVNFSAAILTFFPAGSDPQTWALPEEALGSYGRWQPYYAPVTWDLPSPDELTAPGRVTLTGQIALEDGYAFQDPEETGVVHYTLMYDGENAAPEAVSSIEGTKHDFVLAPGELSSDALLQYLADLDMQMQAWTSRGETFYCGVTWDVSSISLDTPGLYVLQGIPDLPAPFFLTEDTTAIETTTVHITISDPAQGIDLSAPINYGDILSASWSWSIPDLSQTRLEYAKNDGAWQEIVPDDWNDSDIAYYLQAESFFHLANLSANTFHLNLVDLAELGLGDRHYFRIWYGERCSNILKVVLPEDWQDGGLPDVSIGRDNFNIFRRLFPQAAQAAGNRPFQIGMAQRFKQVIRGFYFVAGYRTGVAAGDKDNLARFAHTAQLPGNRQSIHPIHIKIKQKNTKPVWRPGGEQFFAVGKNMNIKIHLLPHQEASHHLPDLLPILFHVIDNGYMQIYPPKT